MIPQIANALSNGFTSKQVIDYIMRRFPEHAEKIKSAMGAGFTVDQILKFISKGAKGKIEQDVPQGTTEYEQMRNSQIAKEQARSQKVLGAATLAAAPLVAPMAQAALQRAIPSNLLQTVSASLPLGQSPLPSATTPTINIPQEPQSNQPQQPPVSPTITQPTGIQQPEGKIIDVSKLFTDMQSKDKIDRLIQAGNGPTEVSGYFKKFHPDIVKNIEKQSGMTFEKAVEQYTAQMPNAIETSSESEIIIPSIDMLEEDEKTPLSKGASIVSPQGVGEIRDIKEKQALVEIDGKLKKIDVDELESEPKDIVQLYDDLFTAIPNEYKSRMMNFAGYDEDANELLFRPHGGAAYVYKNIPSEFAEQLRNRLHKAKTTGSNMYGMWHEGDQSYGAGMSKLIKELQAQYGGKGKEYIRKYNTLFDILGIPHEEKKRREKERREKEKQRKRNG